MYRNIYFIGIGGIGMNALAEYFINLGCRVSGSDLTESHITARLKALGANIFIGHNEKNISSNYDAVVYSSAIKPNNPEFAKALELNLKLFKRAEMLAEIVNSKFLIAVAGTHGKTTTTAMIGKVLLDAGFDPLIFVGGNVNLFGGAAFRFSNSNYAVVEADEYDRSFLTLKPDITVITNIDSDHLDIYKDLNDIKNTFKLFAEKSKYGAYIIFCGDDKNIADIINSLNREKLSYGFNDSNYLKITDYSASANTINFSILNSSRKYDNIRLNLLGKHNALNSAACFAVCKAMNISFDDFKTSAAGFQTVDRRLQVKLSKNNIIVYDDYSHHPTEISASLKSLKESHSGRIISVFQPHLYSRTKDFYKEFAFALTIADIVFITDIYPARETAIEGVSSKLIFDEMQKFNKNVSLIEKNKIISELTNVINSGDVIIFQGAGDITNYCDEFVNYLNNNFFIN